MNGSEPTLLSILVTAAGTLLTLLLRNSNLVTRGISGQVEKAQQSSNGNGAGVGMTSAAIDAQNITSRLLITQMDDFKRETIRRLDDVILGMNEHRRNNDSRFGGIEASVAELTRRVYRLEHPATEAAPVALNTEANTEDGNSNG